MQLSKPCTICDEVLCRMALSKKKEARCRLLGHIVLKHAKAPQYTAQEVGRLIMADLLEAGLRVSDYNQREIYQRKTDRPYTSTYAGTTTKHKRFL